MRVLVTGASSFTGHNIIMSLVNAGINVTGTYGNNNAFVDRLRTHPGSPELVQMDISDAATFGKLSGYFDAIIHIAAISNYVGVENEALIRTNITGTGHVIHYAIKKNIPRIIYSSSTSIYGQIASDSISDKTPIYNPDIYGITKYAGERLLASMENQVSSVSVRLPGVLGVGASRSFVPSLARNLLLDKPVTVFNSQSRFNNIIHVSDLFQLFFQIINNDTWSGFHSFPIGTVEPIKVMEIIKEMKNLLGSNSEVVNKESDKKSFVIDTNYASEEFGFNPQSTVDSIKKYCREIKELPEYQNLLLAQ